MAIFKVIPDQSVVKGTGQGPAFDSDTPAADTLILDTGAFLIATDKVGWLTKHFSAARPKCRSRASATM